MSLILSKIDEIDDFMRNPYGFAEKLFEQSFKRGSKASQGKVRHTWQKFRVTRSMLILISTGLNTKDLQVSVF